MANLGHFNTLTIVREAPPGLYLDGGSHGEILLPRRYIPTGAKAGDPIEVFVHRDSEDRLVATTEKPFATVGQCASLRVVSVKPGVGAFLSWGLDKDLLLPLREQTREVRPLDWIIVHIALDPKSDRIIATARLKRWLDLAPPTYRAGDAVQLLIEAETPLGFRAIVNHTHHGLLLHADAPKSLRIGQTLEGFVRIVREDGKIDLSLEPVGYRRIAPLTEQIMERLRAAGGRLALHDKTPPEEIQAAFGVSKKAFKQALGALYRDQQIRIEPQGIRLAAAKPGKR
jgi:predicted RNA-binding protein (virulence factor B family)